MTEDVTTHGVTVRNMRAEDVPAVDPVLVAAYGTFPSYRARIEASLRQRGILALVAEDAGRVAGAVFGHDYGTSAYVALMGVDPTLQRRGIASALMHALLAWCDERGFADVRLDATNDGAPLYARFDFAPVGETVVFERPPSGVVAEVADDAARVRSAHAGDVAAILALDRRAFGADRAPMLEPLLAKHAALVPSDGTGYAVLKPWADGVTIGPWIAVDVATARNLLAAAVAASDGLAAKLCVPSTNEAAMTLAASAGFVRQRSLQHMIRGARSAPSAMLFGRANLGQG